MSVPKIHYFPVSGRAEFVKILYEEAGAPYEFVSHAPGSQTAIADKLAFGTALPMLEDDGMNLCQSGTIIVRVAKKVGLYPADLKESAVAEMIKDGTLDFIGKYFAAALYGTLSHEDFRNKEVPRWLGFFDKLLHKNDEGKGFVVGKQISFADLCLFQILDVVHETAPKALAEHPTLASFYKRIAERPNIAKYLASERRFHVVESMKSH